MGGGGLGTPLVSSVSNQLLTHLMRRRAAFLLLTISTVAVGAAAQSKHHDTRRVYTALTICDISHHRHHDLVDHRVAIEAEYVNAIPHGVFLLDSHCERGALQIDFPDTGLDPSVALLKAHMFEIHNASGTFRGILKIDRRSGRIYLWLESVLNLESPDYVPELHPIKPLPEPPTRKWPPLQ